MMHVCEDPRKYFDYNAKTRKLFTIFVILAVLTIYMLCLPSSYDIATDKNGEIQTGVYMRASKSDRKTLTINRRDFSQDDFNLVLLNPKPNKVLAIYNGYKLKTVGATDFLTRMKERMASDESAAYFAFLSYFVTAAVMPAGSLTFEYNGAELIINKQRYTNGLKTFRLLCELLV
jgi:hypothetical protein